MVMTFSWYMIIVGRIYHSHRVHTDHSFNETTGVLKMKCRIAGNFDGGEILTDLTLS